jgi:CRISP-associated protein Cas1
LKLFPSRGSKQLLLLLSRAISHGFPLNHPRKGTKPLNAIATCLHYQIPVVFMTQQGGYKGHLWSAEHSHAKIEAAQYQRFTDPAFQMAVAQAIVRGKLWNSKQLLLKLNRRRGHPEIAEAVEGINRDLLAISHLGHTEADLDRLRGYEGTAAARYFPALGQLITHPDFEFAQRHRRPPTDPVNSLLSFGYTLLFQNVLSLLRVEGVNPYLGNLHRSDRHEAQLAFDLMEEFRSPIVDTLVLQLVNQRVFDPEDFTLPNAEGGVYLAEGSRRRFLQAFEARIMKAVKHPDARKAVPYRQVIQLQIRRYKQTLLESLPYEAFQRVT